MRRIYVDNCPPNLQAAAQRFPVRSDGGCLVSVGLGHVRALVMSQMARTCNRRGRQETRSCGRYRTLGALNRCRDKCGNCAMNGDRRAVQPERRSVTGSSVDGRPVSACCSPPKALPYDSIYRTPPKPLLMKGSAMNPPISNAQSRPICASSTCRRFMAPILRDFLGRGNRLMIKCAFLQGKARRTEPENAIPRF